MNDRLPDIARTAPAPTNIALDWVGMRGIDLPLTLMDGGECHAVHAVADAEVDLPLASVKGIHMSRLYGILAGLAEGNLAGVDRLCAALRSMVASHADCGSTRARLSFAFKLLLRQPALVTPGLGGWKSYPVRIDALWDRGRFHADVQVTATYSSTCPCSAALSRQLVADAFAQRFGAGAAVPAGEVSAWLQEHATLATPHSQRSLAEVRLRLARADRFGWATLIARVDAALATPVQTAVKRADEQAFARLNGANLMYVEDAARRVLEALSQHYAGVRVQVRHLESLHAHDAVAAAGTRRGRRQGMR